MIVREAGPGDWARIWPFFREIVAAGETFAYPREVTQAQGREMWMVSAPAHTVVAVQGPEPESGPGRVLGTANMYANRGGPGSHVASASYMVDPAFAGRGIGRALVRYSLDWARSAGFRAMQFNAVAETNVHAVRLYESLGFTVVGTVPRAFLHPRAGYVGLHVMYQEF
ncbi:MAG: GNAT family N-acetyltransferase [Actinocrinis sp.]